MPGMDTYLRPLIVFTAIISHLSNIHLHAFSTLLPSRTTINQWKSSKIFSVPEEHQSELERIKVGWEDLKNNRALDEENLSLLLSPEDFIGVVGNLPLIFESLRTAFTGQFISEGYVICAATTFLTSIAHLKMMLDTPRDFRAPRLAEYRTTYEFSVLYLIPFAWLLWRITSLFPKELENADPFMSSLLTIVSIYGAIYGFFGKAELQRANEKEYEGILLPSSQKYQDQASLYLTGGILINFLACLFIPFAWTISVRGTEWWERVQINHPNEAAFLGVSLLVAIIGDTTGNLFLRMKELKIVKSSAAIVLIGIVSNFLLLLFPEIVFNSVYHSGVSELGFYWE